MKKVFYIVIVFIMVLIGLFTLMFVSFD